MRRNLCRGLGQPSVGYFVRLQDAKKLGRFDDDRRADASQFAPPFQNAFVRRNEVGAPVLRCLEYMRGILAHLVSPSVFGENIQSLLLILSLLRREADFERVNHR